MMISKAQIQQVLKQYGDNTKVRRQEKTGNVSAPRRADEVVLSREALNVQQVRTYMQDIPEVREEKVRDLQEKIRSGTYNVSGEDIAEKVIGQTKINRII